MGWESLVLVSTLLKLFLFYHSARLVVLRSNPHSGFVPTIKIGDLCVRLVSAELAGGRAADVALDNPVTRSRRCAFDVRFNQLRRERREHRRRLLPCRQILCELRPDGEQQLHLLLQLPGRDD